MKQLLKLLAGYKVDEASIKQLTTEYFPATDKHVIVVVLQHGSCGQNITRLYLDSVMHKDLVQSKPVKKALTGIDRQFKELEINHMGSEFEDDNYNQNMY
tara:strand:- start:1402 stop:1701 length:300 start_codon:yes stop_codon:yes gene_type:complete